MSFFKLNVRTQSKTGFINITTMVQGALRSSGVTDGICVVYIPHTTAGVTINEAADPAVVKDMLAVLNKIIPFHDNYAHMEGNSAAHIKTSLMGPSVQIPVEQGRLCLGTWQGIFFCEFDGPRSRSAIVKIIGNSE
ncbi:MAG: YjbQ family protein [Spirochaetales bacterium]|nr:YjbQ family protein [Spirochaetales bacterium]